jgi:hypothetical protein
MLGVLRNSLSVAVTQHAAPKPALAFLVLRYDLQRGSRRDRELRPCLLEIVDSGL